MNYTKVIFLPVLVFLVSAYNASGQVNVSKVLPDNSMAGKNGIFYYLPQTVIRVDLVVNKTDRQKGPYAAYASELLGFENIITQNKTEYEISEVHISSYSQPNPDELYLVEFNSPKNSKQRPTLHLCITPSGMLQGISNSTPDFIQGKMTTDLKGNISLPDLPGIIIPGTYQKTDTIIRQIRRDTIVVEQKELNKVTLSKTTQQKAQEIADNIIQLDKDINNLITGFQEINYSRDAIQFMLSRMEQKRKAYAELFSGTIKSESLNYSYTLVPSKQEAGKSFLLAKFSNLLGISGKDGSGESLQLIFNSVNSTKNLKTGNISGSLASGSKGLVYQLPETTDVVVKLGERHLAEARYQVSQFGVTVALPESFTGNLYLYPETGGIKEIDLK